jgi:hypothetical protein
VIDQVAAALAQWHGFAGEAGLPADTRDKVARALEAQAHASGTG